LKGKESNRALEKKTEILRKSKFQLKDRAKRTVGKAILSLVDGNKPWHDRIEYERGGLNFGPKEDDKCRKRGGGEDF